MPLNLSVGDGEFVPFIKYNAKAGRFYVKGADGGPEIEVEKPRLVFDMANIRTGWIYYAEGAGPEKVWDPSQTEAAPRPNGPQKWKRGFEVMVVGADNIPGVGKLGAREFSSTAGNVITSILQMHAEYEAGMKANANKVPFYVCTGVRPISGHYGTNYEPLFRLHSWIDRSKVPALDEPASDDRVPDVRFEDEDPAPPPPTGRRTDMHDEDIPFAPEFR
jgi:hypothetical protein